MASTLAAKIPLWLDCDPGHDDAFAILFAAHHPNLELLGISTVHGNASLNKTTNNALSVLQAIGRPEVSVFPGAAKPFCREARAAADIHGDSGLDGTNLLPTPQRAPLVKCNAVLEMASALMSCPPNTAWLVTTGALTNIALLFAIYPSIPNHIRGLSIMGGSIGGNFASVPLGPPFLNANGIEQPRIGNVTPYAEFNIYCDPEASQSIFQNRVLLGKTVLIPLDLTHQAFADTQVQEALLRGRYGGTGGPTRLRKMFNELLVFFAQTYADVFGLHDGPPLHDPLAVAVILADHPNPNVNIKFEDKGERWHIDIELSGDQIGRTNIGPFKPGALIPRSLDTGKFWEVLEDCMARADKATSGS